VTSPTRHRWWLPGAILLQLATFAPQSLSATDENPAGAEPQRRVGESSESADPEREASWRWWWAPPADFFPQYIADPRRAQSGLLAAGIVDSEIPESNNPRTFIRLGGRFALFRVHPPGDRERGFQLDLNAGFFGHFDISYSLDNIGWDGVYGLSVSWMPSERWGLRFGTQHDSAHVGDEYGERTGHQRIGYTREELLIGASLRVGERWRGYGELAWGYSLDDFQDPGRVQAGVEYVGPRRFWRSRASLYAALDLCAFEERDWKITPTVQLGFLMPTGRGTSRFRLALEYSSGRSQLGEFSFYDESYLALGLYFDL
jgi:hypothetical protein